MQHYWSLDDVHLDGAWLTVGSFDGVHLGHQSIVRTLVAGSKGEKLPAVLLTFHPHPAVVLNKRKNAYYITLPEERAMLLGDLGVDVVITHLFNEAVASMTARQFVEQLTYHLKFTQIIIGENFALGKDREGDITTLRRLGKEFGFKVTAIPPVINGDEIVSSSRIRSRLSEGDVRSAARLLGRPFRMTGQVVHGDARGKTIGIPTANLEVDPDRAFPRMGVYATRALVKGESWIAVANVGYRPTFESGQADPRVEVHILDFNSDLYGQTINLDFIDYLREEQKFSSIQALIQQIAIDISKARSILAGV